MLRAKNPLSILTRFAGKRKRGKRPLPVQWNDAWIPSCRTDSRKRVVITDWKKLINRDYSIPVSSWQYYQHLRRTEFCTLSGSAHVCVTVRMMASKRHEISEELQFEDIGKAIMDAHGSTSSFTIDKWGWISSCNTFRSNSLLIYRVRRGMWVGFQPSRSSRHCVPRFEPRREHRMALFNRILFAISRRFLSDYRWLNLMRTVALSFRTSWDTVWCLWKEEFMEPLLFLSKEIPPVAGNH